MRQSIVVHLVGDHATLYAAGGALLGVVVGAAATWLQQQSKIKADQAQLAERLAADEKHLQQQLEHDRELQEREALRAILDEALEVTQALYNELYSMNMVQAFGQSIQVRLIGIPGSKLVIRLGREHVVTECYRELRDALTEARHLVTRPLSKEDPDERQKACSRLLGLALVALQHFADTAENLAGSPMRTPLDSYSSAPLNPGAKPASGRA